MSQVHIPSFKSLNCFVIVFKERSISRAASVLGVSQGAVSKQIIELEKHFGFPLFIRDRSALIPTESAKKLFPKVERGFSLITSGVDDLDEFERQEEIHVFADTSFGSRWMPELIAKFNQLYDCRIFMHTLKVEGWSYDIEIEYGLEKQAGYSSEVFRPVCLAPTVSSDIGYFDLDNQTLIKCLYHTEASPSWDSWFTAMGRERKCRNEILVSLQDCGIQMMLQGIGVGLFNMDFIRNEEQNGRVLVDREQAITIPYSYWITLPREINKKKTKKFLDFLHSHKSQFEG